MSHLKGAHTNQVNEHPLHAELYIHKPQQYPVDLYRYDLKCPGKKIPDRHGKYQKANRHNEMSNLAPPHENCKHAKQQRHHYNLLDGLNTQYIAEPITDKGEQERNQPKRIETGLDPISQAGPDCQKQGHRKQQEPMGIGFIKLEPAANNTLHRWKDQPAKRQKAQSKWNCVTQHMD